MTLFADGRAPVWLNGATRPGAAYLVEEGRDAPAGAAAFRLGAAEAGHPAGCACCTSRSGAAAALGRLFQDRARGLVQFGCVVVLAGPAGCEAAREAVADDPLCRAYFRLG